MKKVLQLGFSYLVLLIWAMPVMAQGHTTPQTHDRAAHKLLNQEDIQWQEGPVGLPKGAKFTVLDGDPSKEGAFTLRVTFPANFRIPPHWHPAIEHVTVLKGNFYMGTGEELNMDKAKKVSVGGFAVMPARLVHYAFTKGETIVQVHGIGPFGITYVNIADDPRTAK